MLPICCASALPYVIWYERTIANNTEYERIIANDKQILNVCRTQQDFVAAIQIGQMFLSVTRSKCVYDTT